MKISSQIKCIVLVLVISLTLKSCQQDGWVSPIPYVLVDITVNLNNQEFLPLRLDGGFVEILGGYKGIIIYRVNATTYRAFEKASPYRTDEVCAYMYVDPSGLFLREGCANSVYDFEGNPSGGVSQFPLRQYQTYLDGNFLNIYNESL
ncbi:hypothetical protein [Catalinimonas niigatensis]|uniref:hypothetical protein n=1 Tax=Catalinimonas niigatensis TaxID=1397264 RepID=UPI0026651A69|nr:hypothetical protein [Catalinimonas niigatensis]WPP51039.1 hypothetical protein PZB72_01355 [Catalinimonas niigatensis]